MLALLLLLPPVMIYRAHYAINTLPRLHVVPDMDWQYKFKPQNVGPHWTINREEHYFFPDKRVMREPLPGTVAHGELHTDTEFYTGIKAGSSPVLPAPVSGEARGTSAHFTQLPVEARSDADLQDQEPKTEPKPQQEPGGDASKNQTAPPPDQNKGTQQDNAAPQNNAAPQDNAAAQEPEQPQVPEPDWVTEFPASVTVNQAMIDRGRNRFQIYCIVCHGFSAEGNGLVSQRALELAASSPIQPGTTANATWTQAKSLHDPKVVPQPVGRIFDTITNERGTMRAVRTADSHQRPLGNRAVRESVAGDPRQ